MTSVLRHSGRSAPSVRHASRSLAIRMTSTTVQRCICRALLSHTLRNSSTARDVRLSAGMRFSKADLLLMLPYIHGEVSVVVWRLPRRVTIVSCRPTPSCTSITIKPSTPKMNLWLSEAMCLYLPYTTMSPCTHRSLPNSRSISLVYRLTSGQNTCPPLHT